MKKFMGILAAAVSLCCFGALVEEGKSDYSIIIPPDAVISEKTAAVELQGYLQKMTGVKIPLETTVRAEGRKAIYVGQHPEAAKQLKIDFSTLKPDEIILKRVGNNLFLTGGRPRGVLYAVYEFLEDLGVRRWTFRDEVIPHSAVVPLKEWDYRYAPPFEGRDRLGGVGGTYGAWMRVNGHYLNVPESHGGIIRLIGWCHTFDQMIPPKKYLKTNLEYFALIDGRRGEYNSTLGMPQLCLTNPDVRRILTEKTLEWLRKEKNHRIISFSQNDSWGAMADNYCRCDRCRAIDEREGSPSGSLLDLVNEVAAVVEKEFPDVLIETLAYHYTRKPPAGIRPRPNVIIRFCTANNFLYPWNSGENSKCRDEFLAWSQIAPRIYVWNYTANFGNTMMPHPGWRNYAEDLRFMAANNVIAVLEQGYGRGLTGDLQPLHNYLACKLMWNPNLDQEALIREFLEGYYGEAAPVIREYMDAEWDVFRRNQLALGGSMIRLNKIPLADLLALKAIFDRAEKLTAGDPERLLRVRTAAMVINLPILYAEEADVENADTPIGKALRDRIDLKKLLEITARTYKALNLKDYYRESGRLSIDSYIDTARRKVTGDWSKGLPIPPPCKNIPLHKWRRFGVEDFVFWECCKVDDNGIAALEFPNRTNKWLLHWRYAPAQELKGKWHMYVSMRTETRNKNGKAAIIGSDGWQRHVTVNECAGTEYRWIDCGVREFADRGRIVVAPTGIDQCLRLGEFVLIRE